ncbi:MAG: hypothetical protein KKC68_06050, partial [Candidatus Thermoplasmatota archaeon]|nr:hypothetical protein [Candidatus Thermoplasmatota archaeon]
MRFILSASYTFSTNINKLQKEFDTFLETLPQTQFKLKKDDQLLIHREKIEKNILHLSLESTGTLRPHNLLLQIKNALSKHYGKTHHLGIRNITIDQYQITFDLQRPPLKPVTIPFAQLDIRGTTVILTLTDVSEEFLRNNYIDRIIRRVIEKVDDHYYEGKQEFWKLIWESDKKTPIWTKDPTEEML